MSGLMSEMAPPSVTFSRALSPTGDSSKLSFIDLGGTGQGDGTNVLDPKSSDKPQRETAAGECLVLNKTIATLGKVIHRLVKNIVSKAKNNGLRRMRKQSMSLSM